MDTQQRQYLPNQMHVIRVKRGSAIVALDGALRLSYRDESLDWLLDSAPAVSRLLEEGEHHVFSSRGYVEIYVSGAVAVTGLMLPPSTAKPWTVALARIVSWDSLRRLGHLRRNSAEKQRVNS